MFDVVISYRNGNKVTYGVQALSYNNAFLICAEIIMETKVISVVLVPFESED